MRELEEQTKLVNIVFGKSELPEGHKGFKVYKALVLHRFYELLSNAFPLWYEEVDKNEFKKAVYKFMCHGAKSDVMWKTPNEFRKFISESNLFKNTAYLNDLLWFEWIEVKLIMKSQHIHESKEFSYRSDYILSSSCAIKKLKYKVFERGNFGHSGQFYIMAYYDFSDYEVYYREISELMFVLLKEAKKTTMKKAIEKVAQLSGNDSKDVREFFKDSLKELLDLNIIERIKYV